MSYPNTKLNGMVAFSKAGNTNGGWNGSLYTINSLSELKKHISDNLSKVLIINSNISESSLTKVQLGSNKSIIGSFQNNLLHNIHFRASNYSSNIIFQNLTFTHNKEFNGNDDIQLYLNYGNKYWIDHCSFNGHSWTSNDSSLDKLIYIGEKADYITISNCHFANHKYGLIFGHPDDNNISYDGFPHLSICHNYFNNIEVRSPGLMRYGYFHAYNNYINNFHLGFTLARLAKIISEKNYFGNGSKSNGMLDDKGNGTFTDIQSYPEIKNQKSPKSNWTPSSNYSYTSYSAEYSKEFNVKYSGSQNKELHFGT